MRAAILSVVCLAGLGLSAGSAKAGSFDIVVKFPSWGFYYSNAYPSYYPSIYTPYYPPAVIQPAPIVVAPRVYIPVTRYPYVPYYPPYYPHHHHHHR